MRNVAMGMLAVVCLVGWADAQEEGRAAKGSSSIEQWRFGITVTAQTAPALAIVAAAPIPKDWPEQKVRVVQEDLSPQVRRLSYRAVGEGAKQMVVEIPRLGAGESAHAILTLEVAKTEIEAPTDPHHLGKPAKPSRDLRPYLSPSPQIESDHREIRTLAAELVGDKRPAWESAETIYDWVRQHVQYREGTLKGALAALHDREGDCEELTSLFIALCRASDIPARTVWAPGHCYPEFYLEDAAGRGYWIPCQAAGDRQFGWMNERRPILQKGDNLRLPEERQAVRYAHPILQSTPRPGFAHPTITVLQERVAPSP